MTHIAIDLYDDQETARVLSLLKREHIPYQVQKKSVISAEERTQLHERVMKGGSQTLDVDAMIAYNRQDRPMPFRVDE